MSFSKKNYCIMHWRIVKELCVSFHVSARLNSISFQMIPPTFMGGRPPLLPPGGTPGMPAPFPPGFPMPPTFRGMAPLPGMAPPGTYTTRNASKGELTLVASPRQSTVTSNHKNNFSFNFLPVLFSLFYIWNTSGSDWFKQLHIYVSMDTLLFKYILNRIYFNNET